MQNLSNEPPNEKDYIGNIKITAIQENNAKVNISAITAKNTYNIATDEPLESGGDESAPTPVHLLVGAFAACFETNWIYYSSFAGLDVKEIKVEIDAKIDRRFILGKKDYPARLKSAHITTYICTNESKEKFSHVFEKVRNFCPVGGSLHPDITISYENVFIPHSS